MAKQPNPRQRPDESSPEPVDIHVGKRLRLRRRLQGFTLEEMSALLGVTYQQVYKYETAQNRISASRLYELSVILEVSPDYFFEGFDPTGRGRAERRELYVPSDPKRPSEHDVLQLMDLFGRIPSDPVRRSLVITLKSIADMHDPDCSAPPH
jgi:transcriptional regulator with XRE-family HTH domain